MEDKLFEIMKSLGVSKNEIKIYLALLKTPYCSALDISKKTGIHRSNIYDSLRVLIERGFVYKSLKEEKILYSAVSLKYLIFYLKQKEEELRDIFSKEYLNYLENEEKKTSIYQGIFAVKNKLFELLDLGGEIKLNGYSEEIAGLLGNSFLNNFYEKISEKKIKIKIIGNGLKKSRINRIKKIPNSEFREINTPSKKSLLFEFICKDFFGIYVMAEPIFCVVFKDENLARVREESFDMMWRCSSKFK